VLDVEGRVHLHRNVRVGVGFWPGGLHAAERREGDAYDVLRKDGDCDVPRKDLRAEEGSTYPRICEASLHEKTCIQRRLRLALRPRLWARFCLEGSRRHPGRGSLLLLYCCEGPHCCRGLHIFALGADRRLRFGSLGECNTSLLNMHFHCVIT